MPTNKNWKRKCLYWNDIVYSFSDDSFVRFHTLHLFYVFLVFSWCLLKVVMSIFNIYFRYSFCKCVMFVSYRCLDYFKKGFLVTIFLWNKWSYIIFLLFNALFSIGLWSGKMLIFCPIFMTFYALHVAAAWGFCITVNCMTLIIPFLKIQFI